MAKTNDDKIVSLPKERQEKINKAFNKLISIFGSKLCSNSFLNCLSNLFFII